MGIDTYRSIYGDLTKLQGTPLLNNPDTVTDSELLLLLLAATESVERYCNRHFYPLTTTRYLDGKGEKELAVPDLLAITTLKEDDADAGTFATTWAVADYRLAPYDAEPTKHWGGPYTYLKIRPSSTKTAFTKGTRNFEIVGKWGYRDFSENSSIRTNNAGYSTTATAITLETAGDAAQLAIGQTIKMDTTLEQMLIRNISGDVLTVVRGINGTTATAITAAVQGINIIRWPAPIEMATLIHATRLYQRGPWLEPYYGPAELDVDIRVLLDRYRALTV